ncbi:MAG: flagellar motor switch protein FliM [Rhodobacteraceae bacterium]|nr:MAG: flagellar motor switch protein FliM [Paracoccaceae bacterium]
MSDSAAQSVLRRKLAPHRPPAMPGQQALLHMLAKTMPRDADDLLGLQLAVTGVEAGRISKSGLIAALHPTDLIFLMQSDPPAPGLCTLSAPLLAGLIEVQMSGRVSAADPPDRPPTPVDGIVASKIVDRWIATAKDEALAQEMPDCLPFVRHVRARMLGGARNADLTLDPVDFTTLSITLDLADGARTGTLSFALPAATARHQPVCHNIADDFRAVLMDTKTGLSAVLARLPQTLRAVKALAPGDILDVPTTALGAVTLEDGNGRVLARGRLGQMGGSKAVRLSRPERGAGVEADPAGFRDAGPADAPRRPPPAEPAAALPTLPDVEIPAATDPPDLPEVPGRPD